MEHIEDLRPKLEQTICDWNVFDVESSKKHETQKNLNKLLDMLEGRTLSPEYVKEVFTCAQRLQDDPAVNSILQVLEENAHRFLSESDLRFILPKFQSSAAVFAHLQANEAPTKQSMYWLMFFELMKTPYLWWFENFGNLRLFENWPFGNYWPFGNTRTHNEV